MGELMSKVMVRWCVTPWSLNRAVSGGGRGRREPLLDKKDKKWEQDVRYSVGGRGLTTGCVTRGNSDSRPSHFWISWPARSWWFLARRLGTLLLPNFTTGLSYNTSYPSIRQRWLAANNISLYKLENEPDHSKWYVNLPFHRTVCVCVCVVPRDNPCSTKVSETVN